MSVHAYFCKSPIGLNRKFFDMYQKKALSEEEECLSGLLLSLLKTRENHWCFPQFDIDEINEMIYHVCTLKTWIVMLESLSICIYSLIFFFEPPPVYLFALCTAGT